MQPFRTISFTYFGLRLLTGLVVVSLGCSDEDPPVPDSRDQPLPSRSVGTLISDVLRSVSGDSLSEASLPHQAAALRQTAPSEENDTAYWQWYSQTLALTNATTEYRRDQGGAVFLSWTFNGANRPPYVTATSGRLELGVREEDDQLTVTLRAEELMIGRSRLSGMYQAVWRVRRSGRTLSRSTILLVRT